MKRLTYCDEEGMPHWCKELMEDDTGWSGERIRNTVADMEDAAERPRLDRSAWEPCKNCGCECRVCFRNGTDQCKKCKNHDRYCPASNFCQCCGRPLTDAAWEMLERRLEGVK